MSRRKDMTLPSVAPVALGIAKAVRPDRHRLPQFSERSPKLQGTPRRRCRGGALGEMVTLPGMPGALCEPRIALTTAAWRGAGSAFLIYELKPQTIWQRRRERNDRFPSRGPLSVIQQNKRATPHGGRPDSKEETGE